MPNRWVGSGKTVIRRQSGWVVAPVTLIEDAFTDTNGTNLTAHTIAPTNTPATSWTAVSGIIDVQGNKASSNGVGRYTADAGQADVTAFLDITTVAADGNREGLFLRASDIDNAWFVTLHATNDLLEIVERNAGVNTTRASAAVTVGSATYALRAVLSGNSITATADGANEITYGSASFNATTTKHGIMFNNTGITADNFKATQP